MTAEIAILNKSAVALAADSAVTISAGSKEEKIFDSADKLFELSNLDPIGIMIYNGMSFADIPLQSLVKQFRSKNRRFDKIIDAAEAFLEFLSEIGAKASSELRDNMAKRLLFPLLQQTFDAYSKEFHERFTKQKAPTLKTKDDFFRFMSQIASEQVKLRHEIFKKQPQAKFRGADVQRLDGYVRSLVDKRIDTLFNFIDDTLKTEIVKMCVMALKSSLMSDGFTGIVIAGFGRDELFPTLCSFEIDGLVCGRLKYIDIHHTDIDRSGPKAAVLPFAQKEMADRFLYGLDDNIERNVSDFCEATIPSIRAHIMSRLTFASDADKSTLEGEIVKAEDAFARNLQAKAFEAIRSQSRAAIEDMVEFMPKPELAKMAEALVNLTSIKRRVSRGVETVGGPIDVAIISQAEGFVWVKRKHYFPPELNSRYFERVRDQVAQVRERAHAEDAQHRGDRQTGAGPTVAQRRRARPATQPKKSR